MKNSLNIITAQYEFYSETMKMLNKEIEQIKEEYVNVQHMLTQAKIRINQLERNIKRSSFGYTM